MKFDNDKVQELYPGAIMLQPMLIHNSTDAQLKKACESGDYFGQLKKDGALYQFVKGISGECYLFGRTVSKKTGLLTEKIANVPHIKEIFERLPNGTIILGEIYYPGGSSRNVTEIMGCLPDKAIDRQKDRGWIHYYIYDVLFFNGVDLTKVGALSRYYVLKSIYGKYNLNKYSSIELAEVWYDNLYERIGSALAAGEEGMVIKSKEGHYLEGERPMFNLKAKKVDFADVVITGFEEPTKEYYGKESDNWNYCICYKLNPDNNVWEEYERSDKGWFAYRSPDFKSILVTKPYYMGWHNSRINIGAYDTEGNLINIGTIHSGISDAMKQDMSEHPYKYLNKVCAIQCMEKDSINKTIRHGFFKFMREDKDSKDCTIDAIF